MLLVLLAACSAFAKSGDSFNSGSDVHWDEIDLKFKGICICPRPPPKYYEEGEIWEYWEPFLVEGTVSTANYSAYNGSGGDMSLWDTLSGKNSSADHANQTNESTFAQGHAYLWTMMYYQPCKHRDYGYWKTETDSKWQSDELSAAITPEAALFATAPMQLACMADATAVNLANKPLDFMPWCIGSGGGSYPMNGHVDNDNIVQANNTVAARLLYKLNRMFFICDPATSLCGCTYTPIWIKSHYKTHVVRPADRAPAYPVGKSAKFYDSGLNIPYKGDKGSNDEFLWVFYRKQKCCTCCDN